MESFTLIGVENFLAAVAHHKIVHEMLVDVQLLALPFVGNTIPMPSNHLHSLVTTEDIHDPSPDASLVGEALHSATSAGM